MQQGQRQILLPAKEPAARRYTVRRTGRGSGTGQQKRWKSDQSIQRNGLSGHNRVFWGFGVPLGTWIFTGLPMVLVCLDYPWLGLFICCGLALQLAFLCTELVAFFFQENCQRIYTFMDCHGLFLHLADDLCSQMTVKGSIQLPMDVGAIEMQGFTANLEGTIHKLVEMIWDGRWLQPKVPF